MIKKFTTDDRGVSEVIGAILVFGLLIALLAIFQTQAIPAANEQVEFNHNQDVQSDMVKFQETSTSVANRGTAESARIRMGTNYPNRLIFFNPSDPSGNIRTVGQHSASIENVVATDPTVAKYIDGRITDLGAKRIEYSANYNEFNNPPTTVLEYGGAYREFEESTIIDDPGEIINGNTISLNFYGGNLSRSQVGSMSLEAQPMSAPKRTVSVEPTEEEMELRLPSRLNSTQWEDLLIEEEYVNDVIDDGDFVVIELSGNESYNLEMTQIGVGNDVSSPEPAYLVETRSADLQSQQANRLPFEIRDRYNNPLSGESVNISVDSGEFHNGKMTIESTTTENGQPAARYFADGPELVEVNASFERFPNDTEFDPADNPEDLSFRVAFDSRFDDHPPTFQDDLANDVEEISYSTCTDFGLEDFLGMDLGLLELPVLELLQCTTQRSASQIKASYEVSDEGGAGLEQIQLNAINDNDEIALTETHHVRGAQSTGTFYSSQIFEEEVGDIEEIEMEVYDGNGLSSREVLVKSDGDF